MILLLIIQLIIQTADQSDKIDEEWIRSRRARQNGISL